MAGNSQGDRLRGLFPIALINDQQQPDSDKQWKGDTPSHRIGDTGNDDHSQQRMRRLQHPEDAVDHEFKTGGKPVEEPGAVIGQPVDEDSRRLPDRKFVIGQPIHGKLPRPAVAL